MKSLNVIKVSNKRIDYHHSYFQCKVNAIEAEMYLHRIEGVNIYQMKLFNCFMHMILFFLKKLMVYRGDLMFCTVSVNSGDFLSILPKQRLLYLDG